MTKAVPKHGDCECKANSQLKPKRSGPSGELKEADARAGRRPILFVPGAPDFGPHLEELLTLAGITSTYDSRGDLDSNLQQAWESNEHERRSQQQRPAPELVRQLKSSIKQTQRLLAGFERSHVRDIHFIQAPVGEDEGTVNTATVREMILGSGPPSLPRNPPPLAPLDHIVGADAVINTQRVLDRLLRELDRYAPKRKKGRDLGVRYVLEGSVRKAGNRVRVTGQLVDAASGAHIWGERFDRELTDIFAVQDELTQEIITALKVKLTSERKDRLSRRNTIDEEAYDLFLRGRAHTWHATKSNSIQARELLERAVTINPDFAAAHASIASTYLNDFANGWAENPDESLQAGLEIAERAVQLDESDPEAHEKLAIALFFRRELDKALAEARYSLALAPSSAGGHALIARIMTFSGDPASAIKMIDASMRLDPLYQGLALHFLAEARVSLGQFNEAVATLTERLKRDPNSATSYALLAACFGHLGRIAEARAAWPEAMRIAPNFSIERQRRVLPYKKPADFEVRVEGMRKAGLPV
jgi:tetratricopeptide (TPR) repeat protein